MTRRVGDRDRFPCFAGKFRGGSGNVCPGSMEGVYGGECFCAICSCGGRVTVAQQMNCFCEECRAVVKEVFEYRCDSCGYYGLSDYFTVEDPDSADGGYSWGGVGYPLAELGEEFVQNVIVIARKSQSA